MDGTFTNSRNSDGPVLFKLAGCCGEAELIHSDHLAGHARFIDRPAGFLGSVKQGMLTRGFDYSLPYLYIAVDYAKQF